MVTRVLNGFPPLMELTDRICPAEPTFFSIHLKPSCNFMCKKCFIGEQKKLSGLHKSLSLEEIFKTMENAKKAGAKVFGITGAGEPFLDQRIKGIIKKGKELGLIMYIATNASVLNPELVKFIKNSNSTLIISLDTIDKGKFVHLTGTSEKMFNKVIGNVKMAQEIYRGTKKTKFIGKKNIAIYRIAIHMTIVPPNIGEVNNVKRIVLPDTLFSISPVAHIGYSACNFDVKSIRKIKKELEALTEEHIVLCKDRETNKKVCGFFKYGIDINFDGQLLLDAHAIETRGLFKNIRDFNYDVKAAFNYLLPIKKEFIENYLLGFCPVRSPKIKEWMTKTQARQAEEKRPKNQKGF